MTFAPGFVLLETGPYPLETLKIGKSAMMLKALTALLLLLGIPTMGAAEPAAATTIVLAGEDDWPPYSFADKRSLGAGHEPTGFSPRLIRAAFASQGVNVRFISVPFSVAMVHFPIISFAFSNSSFANGFS